MKESSTFLMISNTMIPEFVFPPTAIMTLCPAQSSYLLSVAMSYLCYYTKPPKDRKYMQPILVCPQRY